ncbi:MAG: tRNA epoxyqueuosine(34) reductase QueG [Nitrospirae bacterium]|nr:MAG: tRNA epoxyqueuosine(34) reductase QueG [Nitrospirota bacterium]
MPGAPVQRQVHRLLRLHPSGFQAQSPMTLTERVKRKALDLGFQAVGVSRVTYDRQEAARLAEWLARGYHGEMGWMARTAKKRQHPALLLPGVRAIVSVGMNYDTEDQPDDRPGHGRIARYARGEDYHQVLGERLKVLASFLQAEAPDSRSRPYVDTGAVMEKAWAQRAGLGWIGKHSNLVSARHGSWLLLGEVLTTADLDPDEPGADLCGTCTLCIRACPTVFGCDDCLDVCPYNHQATPTAEPAFRATPLTLNPDLDALARQSAAEFQSAFRHSAVRRTTHEGLQRSVAVARKNAP